MALAIDASSPVLVASGAATGTTASFTPPANSLIVVLWSGNTAAATVPATPTITDSLGTHLTYTLQQWERRGSTFTADGQDAIWTAPVTSSAAMTISVTNGYTGAGPDHTIRVQVITDGGTLPVVGASAKNGQSSGTAVAMSYTATATGSWGFGTVSDWDLKGAETAGTGTTLIASANSSTAQYTYGFFRRTAADGSSGVTTTINATLPTASTNLQWAAVEIKSGSSAVNPAVTFAPKRRRAGAPRMSLARQGRLFAPVQPQAVQAAPTFVGGQPRRRDLPRAILAMRRQTLDVAVPDQPRAPVGSPRRRPGRRFAPIPLVESGTASLTGSQLVPPRPRQSPRRPRFVLSRVSSATTGPIPAQSAPTPPPWVPQLGRRLRALAVGRRHGNVDVVVPAQQAAVTAPAWVPQFERRVRAVFAAHRPPPAVPVHGQGVPATHTPQPSRRRIPVPFRRAHSTGVVHGQGAPQVHVPAPVRRRVPRPLIRGRDVAPVPTQQAATPNPALPLAATRGLRRFLTPTRRGRTVLPTPAQQAPPTNPPITATTTARIRRSGWLRRPASVHGIVPAQQSAPTNPPITQTGTGRARRLFAVRGRNHPAGPVHGTHNPAPTEPAARRRTPPPVRRAHITEPTPPQVAVVPPARAPQPARRAGRLIFGVVRRGRVAVGRLVGAGTAPYVRPGNLWGVTRPAANLTVEQVNRTGIATTTAATSGVQQVDRPAGDVTATDRPTPGITPTT